ncbi:hypothetical protein GHK92_06955 [Nocardioides sp. dk4132]|nr:hypothetical protein [Nocardioides sp. dk4132]QGA09745.1 hypothetical protein GFH29_14700 [Nocardioides sp. dk884]
MSAHELRRWYWRKDELAAFARALGVSAAGAKAEIVERVCAVLDGVAVPEAAPARRTTGTQLRGPLSEATLIPPGQRCSQVLRAWFTAQVGDGFGFDRPMREMIAAADGTTTLGDALRVWHATRDRPPEEIGEQFELNRFTRRWYAAHPGGSRAELARAWADYRDTPVEERGPA